MIGKIGISNRFIREYFIFTLIILISFNCKKQATKPGPEPEPECQSILLIGSSYFNYNKLPELLKKLANAGGKCVTINSRIPHGVYLDYHAKNDATESIINEKKWDYVVFQGDGRLMAHPDVFTDHPLYPALETLRNKIVSNSESTKMTFCLPWAYEDGIAWNEGWTDLYSDMQMKIYHNTLEDTDDIEFIIAPVGMAWKTFLEEKDFPLHYLHLSDWNHPSLRGSYLMACVICATIFQQDLNGIDYFAGLPEDEAKYFQSVASSTVLDSLELWNIIPSE